MRDFAWWSGLTLTDARTALAAAGDALASFDDEHLVAADAGWAADPASTTPRTSRRFALAAFDEYFLGYTDRSDVCDPLHAPRVVPGLNGVFQPILVNGAGVVEGLWKATRAKGAASVALDGFDRSIDPSGLRARPRPVGAVPRRTTGHDHGGHVTARREMRNGRCRDRGTARSVARSYCSSAACSSRVMVTWSPSSTPPVSRAAL